MSLNSTKRYHLVSKVILMVGLMMLPLLFGCSGGGSSDDSVASGGIGGTGATAGLVSDYGSIFVNGVEFDTSNADVLVEGEWVGSGDQAARSNLPIGQAVVVQGPFLDENAGTAIQIDAYHRVQGPIAHIESIDDTTRRITILGQTIFVDPETTLSGTTSEDLTPDMVLRVSGVPDESGAIHAGLVAVQTPDSQASLKGTLRQPDPHQKTFMINDQMIDYSQVQPSPDMQALENRAVSVTGALDQTILIARSISQFDTENFNSLDEFGIDGFIQGPIAPNRWRLGPYQVELDVATMFEGLLSEDLTQGIRVQLQGELRNRVLFVNRVRSATRAWLESRISSVDEDRGTIALDGMAGLTIHTNSLTRIRGDADQFSDLRTDDHVRVYAHPLDDRSANARFVFETVAAPLEDRFRIKGPVTAISDPLVDILGVEIDTTANLGIAFIDINGQTVTQSDFVDALSTESTVHVKGQWINGFIVYEEMTIVR